jgi:L-fuculose-phosphate aldolase
LTPVPDQPVAVRDDAAETGSGDETAVRESVVQVACALTGLGLTQGTSGNVSRRWGGGFLITPSGVPPERLTAAGIAWVSLAGWYRGPQAPSTEWRMHRDIYVAHSMAGGVVHCHSPHATALACLRRRIPPFHYMVAAAGGQSIEVADYATFGTEALSQAMLAALGPRRACLLANHGQISWGRTVERALALAVEVEALASQYGHACTLGQPVLLTDAEMAAVLARFAAYGKPPDEVDEGDRVLLDLPPRRRDRDGDS